MALARAHVWNVGDLLKSADLNGEFNNILLNPIALISPTTGAIDFNLQAHTNLLPSAISATSGTTGQALVVGSTGLVFGTPSNIPLSQGSRVRGLAGVLTSQTGTFTADQYVLQTTIPSSGVPANAFVLGSTASFTVNLGTAGPTANGRDVAAVLASTDCHWYAISTGAGSTTPAGIVSSQPPSVGPVMPTNYSAWCYLGVSKYSTTSTTVKSDHRFRGQFAYYDAKINIVNATAVTTSEHIQSLTSALPANAGEVKMIGKRSGAIGATATSTGITRVRVVSGSDYVTISAYDMAAATAGDSNTLTFEMPNVGQSFIYLDERTGTNGTVVTEFDVTGYSMPNGA